MLQLELQLPYDLPIVLFFVLPHFLMHLPFSIVLLHVFLQLCELLPDSLKLFLDHLEILNFLKWVLERIVELGVVFKKYVDASFQLLSYFAIEDLLLFEIFEVPICIFEFLG